MTGAMRRQTPYAPLQWALLLCLGGFVLKLLAGVTRFGLDGAELRRLSMAAKLDIDKFTKEEGARRPIHITRRMSQAARSHFDKWGYQKNKTFTSILEEAPAYCYNASYLVNAAGNGIHYEVTVDEPVEVRHYYRKKRGMGNGTWGSWRERAELAVREMERLNLWMFVGRSVNFFDKRVNNFTRWLRYIPGKTIIFDDLIHALHFIGNTSFKQPLGVLGKAAAMRLLSSALQNYDSIVFRQHLDFDLSCAHQRCCTTGSELVQEIVALRGWNISACPGHPRLRHKTGKCECLHTRFC